MEHPSDSKKPTSFWSTPWVKEVREIVLYILLALVIVVPIRLFVAQPFIVSGESMYPTFNNRDYLIVDELSYEIGHPKRGDVVIFRYPKDPKRFFIKRIIGLPGERLHVGAEGVTIYNDEYPGGFKLTEPYAGHMENIGIQDIVLDEGTYFVMGDNRPASSDSRVWGPLPEKMIIGKAWARLLPLGKADLHPGNLESFGLTSKATGEYSPVETK